MKFDKQIQAIKLCVLCFPYYPSKDTGRGHDRYIFELIENIKASYQHVQVEVLEQGIAKGLRAAGGKLLKSLAQLVAARADVYHATSPMGGATAIMLGKSPLVVTIHDLIPFHVTDYDYSWKYQYIRFCTKLCVSKSDAIVVPYQVTRDEVINSLGADPAKVHVVSYGVDHATYHPKPELKRSPLEVLYIGEVSRSKGVDVLIEAFATIERRVPGAQLVIGGKTNKDQPLLEDLSRKLGVRNITFKGFVPEDELATYYSSTAVMVFPSRYGFGLSVLEAMSCGTPVVVAAALDAPEFIADAGMLVQPGDAVELADAIVRLLTDTQFREQLAQKGFERAQGFSWSNMAAETSKLYEQLLARRRD